MLGIAQQLFIERYARNVWPMPPASQEATSWPLLQKMLSSQHLGYVDLALAQKLLTTTKQADESRAALICHLSMAARQGHLCATIYDGHVEPSPEEVWQTTDKNDDSKSLSAEDLAKLQALIIAGTRTAIFPLITSVEKSGTDPTTPLCKWHHYYYLQRYWLLETLFLQHLQPLLSDSTLALNIDLTRASTNIQQLSETKTLQPEQATAILQGCQHPFTMITGGPGTGKTYIAGMLLRVLWESMTSEQQRNCRISLAAPTGKAAANLEMSIQRALQGIEGFPTLTAQTLHSLLGVRKHTLRKTYHILDADILLVDECSMIDVRIMGDLLAALKPGARLILLGDPHQLPPVEAGSLFADLVAHLQSASTSDARITNLKTCLRAELHTIIDLADKVNEGDYTGVQTLLEKEKNADGIHQVVFTEEASTKEIQRRLLSHALPRFPLITSLPSNPLEALKEYARFRILTPLRQGPLGVEELNALFFKSLSVRSQEGECMVIPIMIVRNNHRLELFNGEVGLLVKYHGNPQRDIAIFAAREQNQGVRTLSALILPAFEYAYCVSVHKSQGSEFEHVVMLLPPGAESFGREALYTGITRARRRLEIWSSLSVLQQMMARKSKRHSGVAARLETMKQ